MVIQVLRYLKGLITQGLHIKPSQRLELTCYSDANLYCWIDDRMPIVGYCVYFNDSLVSWSSKKQHVVARSSIELEYRALVQVPIELARI